jgi:hypothetical protein
MGFCTADWPTGEATIKPVDAADVWPEALTQLTPAVLAGSRTLFKPIESVLPTTYEVLCKESGPLAVLRTQFESTSIVNFGEMVVLYRLVLSSPAGIVGIEPMTEDAETLELLGTAEFIGALPDGLAHVYDTIAGMTLAGSIGPEINGYDLPGRVSQRRPFDQCFQRLGVSAKIRSAVETLSGPDADLMVWIWGTVGDHVLLDINRKTDNLFVVSTDPAIIPHRLTQPAAALDRYFSNALRGFPEPSML